MAEGRVTAPGSGARPLRVLGVDPGLANLGLGAIEEVRREAHLLGSTLITTSPRQDQSERLLTLRRELLAFIALHEPDVMAIEGQFLRRQPQTSFLVGQAVGVVLVTAAEVGLPTFEYGPEAVKRSLVGNGRADKAQVAFMVRALLKLTSVPEANHETDAIALALTHLHARRLGALS